MTLMPITRRDGSAVLDTGPQAPQGGFLWGQGGAMVSPEQLALERRAALGRTQGDYSPIASPWQGLARVADNVIGALQLRNLDKREAAQQDAQSKIIQALVPGNEALATGLASPNPVVAALAGDVFKSQLPKQVAPHYWETNNGSLGMIGADGRPQIVYEDPTPKINWITADNPDGTKSLIPVGPNGPMQGGGGPASPALGAGMLTAPVGKLTPIDPSQMGGPSQPAAGGFRPRG